jgi:hypothetical protein
VVTDPTDGQLAHLDGLNLSRAWMLEGIASVLHRRISSSSHRLIAAGVKMSGTHMRGARLGTFAMYLVTGRGLR